MGGMRLQPATAGTVARHKAIADRPNAGGDRYDASLDTEVKRGPCAQEVQSRRCEASPPASPLLRGTHCPTGTMPLSATAAAGVGALDVVIERVATGDHIVCCCRAGHRCVAIMQYAGARPRQAG